MSGKYPDAYQIDFTGFPFYELHVFGGAAGLDGKSIICRPIASTVGACVWQGTLPSGFALAFGSENLFVAQVCGYYDPSSVAGALPNGMFVHDDNLAFPSHTPSWDGIWASSVFSIRKRDCKLTYTDMAVSIPYPSIDPTATDSGTITVTPINL